MFFGFNFLKGLVLHVSASRIKFLETAEEMEIVKLDINKQLREFSVEQLEDFLPDGMHAEDLFSTFEKQQMVRHELDNIRALAEDDHIPGYPEYTLYEGQSIIQSCLQCELITQMYPLHEYEILKKLGRKWYLSLLKKQPFGKFCSDLYYIRSKSSFWFFLVIERSKTRRKH